MDIYYSLCDVQQKHPNINDRKRKWPFGCDARLIRDYNLMKIDL